MLKNKINKSFWLLIIVIFSTTFVKAQETQEEKMERRKWEKMLARWDCMDTERQAMDALWAKYARSDCEYMLETKPTEGQYPPNSDAFLNAIAAWTLEYDNCLEAEAQEMESEWNRINDATDSCLEGVEQNFPEVP